MTTIRPDHTNEHSTFCSERNVAGMRKFTPRVSCVTCRPFDAGRASLTADLNQLTTVITPDGLVLVVLEDVLALLGDTQ